jgi:Rrf2 family protein
LELIRQDTDYALRAVTHLALMQEGRKATAADLSAAQDIPLSFCHKILRRLVAARLVASRPGRAGGFVLARPPSSIRLLDVVVAVQGPVAVSPCMMNLDACPRRAGCPVSRKWKKLQEKVVAFLRTTKLADVTRAAKT